MKLKISKFMKVQSTNTKAINLIRENKLQPRLIVAKKQTKGKGTMGKKWVSKAGNLFISIYFDLSINSIKSKEISILNPYIVRNILKKYCVKKIKIKWPNDLLIEGKKICGILQEVISFNNKNYLIIGIGINTAHSPINKNFKSASLVEYSGKKVKNMQILNDIKLSYEKFISDIRKYKFLKLKKKIIKN